MDLSLQPARPHSQTLMLSNHLVITTVEFLNNFAAECDAKLCKLHQKMQRLEVEVRIRPTPTAPHHPRPTAHRLAALDNNVTCAPPLAQVKLLEFKLTSIPGLDQGEAPLPITDTGAAPSAPTAATATPAATAPAATGAPPPPPISATAPPPPPPPNPPQAKYVG